MEKECLIQVCEVENDKTERTQLKNIYGERDCLWSSVSSEYINGVKVLIQCVLKENWTGECSY